MAGVNIHKKVEFHLKHNALHNELHIKPGKKIPVSELEKKKASAKKSGNTKLEKRVTFALNARHFKH